MGRPSQRDVHDRGAVGSLTSAQRRYVAIETVIAAVINALLSLAFVVLVFGGRTPVPALGRDGLVVDAVPQTLMVALMSALVPGLLTRKRLRDGRVEGAPPLTIGAIVGRAIIVAILMAVVLTGIQFLLLRQGPSDYPFHTVLIGKTFYGAILGAVVANRAVRSMLNKAGA